MKLRLRPLESKETVKIDAPSSCTLPGLKQILAQALPNSPSPASIRLSLNRKDELLSNGEESLHSLGIAAGDLIFFSVEQQTNSNGSSSQNTLPLGTVSSLEPDLKKSECSSSLSTPNSPRESQNYSSLIVDSQEGETLGNGSKIEETVDEMEGETEDNAITVDVGGFSADVVDKSFSVPSFLRKVFMKELDDSGHHHKLIVIAIHAVMMESGFVCFDKNTNEVVSGFQFLKNWSLGLAGVSLVYTLPESLNRGKEMYTVVLKFQCLGNFINVYGTLGNGCSKKGTYWVQLNEDHLVPFLNIIWANCGVTIPLSDSSSPEKEVFKFWRSVKDNITLPLLIDLCEEAGLELPPCFMRLPTDLKLKILEYLNGVEVGRVSCVSSEMRYLCASDDLWWLKFTEEFGNGKERKESQRSWKNAFAILWDRKKNRKLPEPYWRQPRRRYSNPLMVPRIPRIIGGEYDLAPFGNDLHDSMRNFSPPCNLRAPGSRFF